MKEQLIKLAKEKGFKGGKYYTPQTPNDIESIKKAQDLEDYLWLCELQKWLREKHNLHVEAASNLLSIDAFKKVRKWYIYLSDDKIEIPYDSYKIALGKGSIEALKLINL